MYIGLFIMIVKTADRVWTIHKQSCRANNHSNFHITWQRLIVISIIVFSFKQQCILKIEVK